MTIRLDRRAVFSAAGALACAAALPCSAAADATADAAAVQALLADHVAAWNAGDAERMYANATDTIHWVNIVGMHWRGKADVVRAHHVYLTTIFRNVPMTLEEVESITPIGDNVLAVVARLSVAGYTTPGGFQSPPSTDRMTLILLRTPAGLRMAHVANIQINAAAQAHNPIRPPAPAA